MFILRVPSVASVFNLGGRMSRRSPQAEDDLVELPAAGGREEAVAQRDLRDHGVRWRDLIRSKM